MRKSIEWAQKVDFKMFLIPKMHFLEIYQLPIEIKIIRLIVQIEKRRCFKPNYVPNQTLVELSRKVLLKIPFGAFEKNISLDFKIIFIGSH